MEVVKLNKEKMSRRNKKKKPTNNDIVSVINLLIQDVHHIKNRQDATDGTLDFYIEMKKDGPELKEFIDSKLNIQQKEDNELPATGQSNTVADKENLTD